jgi:hypothetical protein
MKAEHRKELETNTLADRMGHVMQRVKTGRRSTFFIYVIVGAVLVVGLYFAYFTYISGKQETSERWIFLDDGGMKNLGDLATKEPESMPGKAARFQMAWIAYWELGVKRLGAEPEDAKQKLNFASDSYKTLIKDCADDELFEPQALLGFAVVEETKAIVDTTFLLKALEAYKAVVEKSENKYMNTAEGKFAQERIDILKDEKKRNELAAVYTDLRDGLNVRALPAALPNLQAPLFPPGHPPLPDKK